MTWNVEVLCEAILARTVRTLEAPTILAVLDARDRPIYSKESLAGADRVLAVPFRERLATWRLAVYQPPGAVAAPGGAAAGHAVHVRPSACSWS